MPSVSPFHLAIPVANLEQSRRFYRDVLGCDEGRSDVHWVDFNLFGHQLVIHEVAGFAPVDNPTNEVDGHHVPVPHFGVVLPWEEFDAFVNRLKSYDVSFVIAPYLRFEGLPGEQKTMFFYDPNGHALEFKSFKNLDALFATE